MPLSLSSFSSVTVVLVLWLLAGSMTVTDGESIRGQDQHDITNESRQLWPSWVARFEAWAMPEAALAKAEAEAAQAVAQAQAAQAQVHAAALAQFQAAAELARWCPLYCTSIYSPPSSEDCRFFPFSFYGEDGWVERFINYCGRKGNQGQFDLQSKQGCKSACGSCCTYGYY